MNNRMVKEKLRYKDRGEIEYVIVQGFDGTGDCLTLNYYDDEKTFSWEYHFSNDGKSPLEHIKEASYEQLKAGFVENLYEREYSPHRGEYQLLKEAVVIFVSHKKYILDICQMNGMC